MQSKNKTKETVSCGVGCYLKVRLFVALTCDELFKEQTFFRYGIHCLSDFPHFSLNCGGLSHTEGIN